MLRTPGLYAQLACLWEATARKPGNVHRFADFADVHYLDFLLSALALGKVLDLAPQQPLSQTILDAVEATRQLVQTNTNLGMILLLAPLAAVPPTEALAVGVAHRLDELTVADSRRIYQAIRLAQPGGLGEVQDQSIAKEPTLPFRAIMALAQDRDMIARQYVNGFREVLEQGVSFLQEGLAKTAVLEEAIIFCHLCWLAAYPDSLIARKRGRDEAEEAAQRAGRVLQLFQQQHEQYPQALAELDTWLRADGHSRNPGTTADLVTACLFVSLREGIITLPLERPWSRG